MQFDNRNLFCPIVMIYATRSDRQQTEATQTLNVFLANDLWLRVQYDSRVVFPLSNHLLAITTTTTALCRPSKLRESFSFELCVHSTVNFATIPQRKPIQAAVHRACFMQDLLKNFHTLRLQVLKRKRAEKKSIAKTQQKTENQFLCAFRQELINSNFVRRHKRQRIITFALNFSLQYNLLQVYYPNLVILMLIYIHIIFYGCFYLFIS